MKTMSFPLCVLHIAALQSMLWESSVGSVLPRPNYRTERTTTQLFNTAKNYSDEAFLIVTSSELPKQIPPPPTPTKSHGVTPQYETRWIVKDADTKVTAKYTSPLIPYNVLENTRTFQKLL